MAEGLRYDEGKPPMDLLPPDALISLAQVYAFGAKKYAPHSWAKGMRWGRVFGSLMRHLLAFWSGEDFDEESGLPHVDHIAWNAITLSAYFRRGVGEDDRFKLKTGQDNTEKTAPYCLSFWAKTRDDILNAAKFTLRLLRSKKKHSSINA